MCWILYLFLTCQKCADKLLRMVVSGVQQEKSIFLALLEFFMGLSKSQLN